jgi:hypothetical protein
MKKAETEADELQPEYDFSQMKGRSRGKYVGRYRAGANLALPEPDAAEAIPDVNSVKEESEP